MPAAIANTVRFTGLSLEEVGEMATTRPAEYIGIRPAGRVRVEWDAEAATLRIAGVASSP
jgi:N-acetylglucosamine-6-phosphate deacetylase